MEELDVEPTTTPIPGAGLNQKHLGFEWGPGDLLVFETNFNLQGPGSGGSGCPFVHIVRRDEDIYSPILRKLFNESHHIFVGLQNIQDDVPNKNKRPHIVRSPSVQQPAGSLLLHLLDWVRLHKADVDERARDVLQSESPTRHHAYWDMVMSFVLQGRMDEARQVLQKQASLQPASAHWHEECDRCLQDNSFASNSHLETICKVLVGDEDALMEQKELLGTCMDMFLDCHGAPEPLDSILLAAFEFDLHQVIKDCR
ncbi:Nuclear pore complex protein Nup85 [Bagarius yarrelli]|uniref:Nuclear pore complex protein Nup85 n=1 Tax=Bagarius yarrelli TaxID=175774 RepID=A0A556V7L3_BAGYA|nr:Nuclear pore complex protein Nup85 [Bagarius yarrelli]